MTTKLLDNKISTLFILLGCSLFAYTWKLPAYSGAFLLAIDNFSFFTNSWNFCTYSFSLFTYNWSFFAYNRKVRLISTLRDCKQRSLTVRNKLQQTKSFSRSRKSAP